MNTYYISFSPNKLCASVLFAVVNKPKRLLTSSQVFIHHHNCGSDWPAIFTNIAGVPDKPNC